MTAQRQDATLSRPEVAGHAARVPVAGGQAIPAPERSPDLLRALKVLEALTRLNSIDRAALRLIYWSGMTQTQVSRELHLPEQVIRQCVARGMRELAANLTAAAHSNTTVDRR